MDVGWSDRRTSNDEEDSDDERFEPVTDGGSRLNGRAQQNDELFQPITSDNEYTKEEIREFAGENVQKVIDSVGVAHRIVDTNFDVVMQNERMEELTGVTQDDMRGHDLYCYDQFSNDDVCGTENCTLKQIVDGDADEIEVEVPKIAYDGNEYQVEVVARPIYDAEGSVVAISESFNDRTELKTMVEEMNDVVDRISSGQLDAEATVDQYKGYYREMGESINELVEVMQLVSSEIRELVQNLNDRNLEQIDISNELPGEYGTIAEELDECAEKHLGELERMQQVTEEVELLVRETLDSAETVAETSEEISDLSEDEYDRMNQIASEISNLSATVEEVAANTEDVSDTVSETAEMADRGRESAEETVQVMQNIADATDTVTSDVERLHEAVEEIDEVIDVINEIADQTNMLALNANIEAARAGEAGEGFAVVANEVKSLAEESQQHAAEIESMIETIQDDAQHTMDSLETASDEVARGEETVSASMERLEDIADRVDDVAVNIQEVSEAADDQATSTEEVASMTDEAADSIESLRDEIQQIAEENQAQLERVDEIEETVATLRE